MEIKICLDAGHAGKYNRSPVNGAYYESDMVWKLHLLQKEILLEYGFDVRTTRTNQNTDRALVERGKASRGCALFISDHSNACGSESVDYPVAIALLDDKKILIDDESRAIGTLLARKIGAVMGTRQPGRIMTRQSTNDRDKNGILDDEYYGVLHGAKSVGTPGIILEHSFHTNKKATEWLMDDNNLRKLAEAECEVIAAYFGVKKKETEEGEEPLPFPEPKEMSRAEFIEYVGAIAREDWEKRHLVLPSVVVAQAIKESGAGKSELAQRANAIFGIKRNGWDGEVYVKDATEQNADGSYRVEAATEWRAYGSWRESIIDHNTYLATRQIGNETEPHWKELIGVTDYRKVVHILQSVVPPYASSQTYEESIIKDYIEKENLTRFDTIEGTTAAGGTVEESEGYRVQAGAFRKQEQAQSKVNELKNDGFNAIIIEEDGLFKVQSGYYRVKANADAQLGRLLSAGHEAFIKIIRGAEQARAIQKGDIVTVLKAETYDGKAFRVYYDRYNVINLKNDRAVIGVGKTVTCAINVRNIALV